MGFISEEFKHLKTRYDLVFSNYARLMLVLQKDATGLISYLRGASSRNDQEHKIFLFLLETKTFSLSLTGRKHKIDTAYQPVFLLFSHYTRIFSPSIPSYTLELSLKHWQNSNPIQPGNF